jgi:hypothetical protein
MNQNYFPACPIWGAAPTQEKPEELSGSYLSAISRKETAARREGIPPDSENCTFSHPDRMARE